MARYATLVTKRGPAILHGSPRIAMLRAGRKGTGRVLWSAPYQPWAPSTMDKVQREIRAAAERLDYTLVPIEGGPRRVESLVLLPAKYEHRTFPDTWVVEIAPTSHSDRHHWVALVHVPSMQARMAYVHPGDYQKVRIRHERLREANIIAAAQHAYARWLITHPQVEES